LGLKFKGHKMNQTPLTNMEGRWLHSTKEAFDALVAMGYVQSVQLGYLDKTKCILVHNSNIHTFSMDVSNSLHYPTKQAYFHNGHFYDQPYEEFTITDEKVPFPELEDIEVDKDGNLVIILPEFLIHIIIEIDMLNDLETIPIENQYRIAKLAYENGIQVTWKLKEKKEKFHCYTCMIELGNVGCTSKYAIGDFCSQKCADIADFKFMLKECKDV